MQYSVREYKGVYIILNITISGGAANIPSGTNEVSRLNYLKI